VTQEKPLVLEALRRLLLDVETEIGRNVCADPVIDIILLVAVENARGRFPTVTEAILAAGSATETTRRFVDVLIARQALIKGDQGGLSVSPRILAILNGGLARVCD
jgi:hypothetical protein